MTTGNVTPMRFDDAVRALEACSRPEPWRWSRLLRRAHAVHHRTGRAPYGFLVPIVPPRHQAAVASLRPVDTRALVENTS